MAKWVVGGSKTERIVTKDRNHLVEAGISEAETNEWQGYIFLNKSEYKHSKYFKSKQAAKDWTEKELLILFTKLYLLCDNVYGE